MSLPEFSNVMEHPVWVTISLIDSQQFIMPALQDSNRISELHGRYAHFNSV
jgi:hypothetical protein